MEKEEEGLLPQRVLDALDAAYIKLSTLENKQREAIAVMGMACRFPGHVKNSDDFWQLLSQGNDAVNEVPSQRWDVKNSYPENLSNKQKTAARYGAFIDDVDQFDEGFFGLSPREAISLDPQQRLLLELSWEALENAGQSTEHLKQSKTGVFIGVTTHDYASLVKQAKGIDQYFASGNALNALAGRLSYCLGLQGPSLAIDTACSSSLVAIHMACQSLRAGECDMALVGGSNLMLSPDTHYALAQADMLAQNGQCKTFDALADGYVRGEGCAVIVLKRISDAKKSNDPILSSIKGSAVNQDGASGGFTVPNGIAQQEVIREALNRAGIAAQDVDYLEAHGTGTPLGDPIELKAANAVYGEQRDLKNPLWVSSVKTNIGHLEASAGIAALIKVVLALQHKKIPAHLHYKQPNPHVPWQQLSLCIAEETIDWNTGEKPRIAAISAFGASGTNAHLIMQEVPQTSHTDRDIKRLLPAEYCLLLSAKTESALVELAQRYVEFIISHQIDQSLKQVETESSTDHYFLSNLCYSAATRRVHFKCRLSIVVDSIDSLADKLQCFVQQEKQTRYCYSNSHDLIEYRQDYVTQLDALLSQQAIQQLKRYLKENAKRPLEKEIMNVKGFEQGNTEWQRLLTFAQLYVLGYAIDWQAFYQNNQQHYHYLPLPNYPWQHTRHWITEPIASSSLGLKDSFYRVDWQTQALYGLNPDYLLAPVEIQQQLQTQLKTLKNRVDLQHYWQLIEALEALSIDYVLQALQLLAGEFQQGQHLFLPDFLAQHNILQRHQRLVKRLFTMLVEVGYLTTKGSHWLVIQLPKKVDPQQHWQALKKDYPDADIELTLIQRCGEKLADVLQGRCDPLAELLFPEDQVITVANLYQDALASHVMNELLQQAISITLKRLPKKRQLRILEIGAGTGGTSRYVLPHLPEHQVSYCFTDISTAFLSQAQEKFHAFSFIDYQQLDIEKTLADDHEYLASFDLIIAANVLHATKNLSQSLKQIQRLLVPQGQLICLENTQPLRFLDLIFGLTEGWWHFNDTALRADHALLSVTQWQSLLQDTGFDHVAALAAEADEKTLLSQQAVLLAQVIDEELDEKIDEKPELDRQHSDILLTRYTEQKNANAIECNKNKDAYLIFAEDLVLGQALKQQVDKQNKIAILVSFADTYQQLDNNCYQLNPSNTAHLERFFQLIDKSVSKPAIQHVVVLSGADVSNVKHQAAITKTTKTIEMATLWQQSVFRCEYVLHILQSLVKHTTTFSLQPRLWLVTQYAMPLGQQVSATSLSQTSLWGMRNVIALEHPEFDVSCVDLNLDTQAAQALALWEEIQASAKVKRDTSAEDQIILQDEQRYVARLKSYHLADSQQQLPLVLKEDVTYCVTGGLKGVGWLVSQWLVERGARYLLLLGRSDVETKVQQQLNHFRQQGVIVITLQVDVADEVQISQALSEVRKVLPRLGGVIHAAGVLDDGVLLQQSKTRFETVMAAKIRGAWALHQLTKDEPLDFFVLFSTTVALFGSAGQVNHAAANSFLDALAHYRHAQGLPALSINWGPWSEIGAAAEIDVAHSLKWKGITPLQPQQGLLALEMALLQKEQAQLAVINIDWLQFPKKRAEAVFFSECRIAASKTAILNTAEYSKLSNPTKPIADSESFIDQLNKFTGKKRRTYLLNHIRDELATVLAIQNSATINPQYGFFELGMDSLTSIEFRNRLQKSLGCTLAATVAFDYPSVHAMVDYLLQHVLSLTLEKEALVKDNALHVTENITDDLTQFDHLSADDLNQLLDETLTDISLSLEEAN